MTHLRLQDPSDRRWARHKKDGGGCCLRGESKPTCKCAALEYVMDLLQTIVSTQPRPCWDDEREADEGPSQTQSEQENPEATQMINGSAAKNFRRSTQGNGPSLPKKREQKQLDKKVGQKANQEVRFSNQQVLVDSENKAHHVQLHTPGGNQMSFGKELDSIHRQQLSITATTAQSSGNDPRTLDSSQAKLLQLNISRYQPPPFDSSHQG